MSRLETLRAQDVQPDLPPAGIAGYLVGHLFDAGPIVNTAQGSAALGWRDLQAWQAATGVVLSAWEARAVRTLSQHYLHSAMAAKNPACPAPYAEQPTADQRTQIATTLRSIFSSFKKAA